MKQMCPTCGRIQHPGQVHACSEWRGTPITLRDVLEVAQLLAAILLGIALVSTPWLVTR